MLSMLNSWENIPFPLILWDASDLHSRKLAAGSQTLVVEILFCKGYFQVPGCIYSSTLSLPHGTSFGEY